MKKHYKVIRINGEYYLKFRYYWLPIWFREVWNDPETNATYHPHYDTLREALLAVQDMIDDE